MAMMQKEKYDQILDEIYGCEYVSDVPFEKVEEFIDLCCTDPECRADFVRGIADEKAEAETEGSDDALPDSFIWDVIVAAHAGMDEVIPDLLDLWEHDDSDFICELMEHCLKWTFPRSLEPLMNWLSSKKPRLEFRLYALSVLQTRRLPQEHPLRPKLKEFLEHQIHYEENQQGKTDVLDSILKAYAAQFGEEARFKIGRIIWNYDWNPELYEAYEVAAGTSPPYQDEEGGWKEFLERSFPLYEGLSRQENSWGERNKERESALTSLSEYCGREDWNSLLRLYEANRQLLLPRLEILRMICLAYGYTSQEEKFRDVLQQYLGKRTEGWRLWPDFEPEALSEHIAFLVRTVEMSKDSAFLVLHELKLIFRDCLRGILCCVGCIPKRTVRDRLAKLFPETVKSFFDRMMEEGAIFDDSLREFNGYYALKCVPDIQKLIAEQEKYGRPYFFPESITMLKCLGEGREAEIADFDLRDLNMRLRIMTQDYWNLPVFREKVNLSDRPGEILREMERFPFVTSMGPEGVEQCAEVIREGWNKMPRWAFCGQSPEDVAESQKRKGEKIGRNDPCPCGSGTKYKKCCGR